MNVIVIFYRPILLFINTTGMFHLIICFRCCLRCPKYIISVNVQQHYIYIYICVCVCVCVNRTTAFLSSVSVCNIVSVHAFFNMSLVDSDLRTANMIDRDLFPVITFYERY